MKVQKEKKPEGTETEGDTDLRVGHISAVRLFPCHPKFY
jgi:hypothetical protein